MPLPRPSSRIVALLGPTNTGKTHRAVERMLEHDSGMIGLPLRLLAREVYDRVSARAGEQAVALITGEEKRVPPRPRYWVCTVEAMPTDLAVDFLAVDEIQLAGDRERGHVFTDRLLNSRGRLETWFLGAATMRPLVQMLVPTASIKHHERLSTLTSAGCVSLGGLPPRTAVVAFSAARVYELAERIRARRGGAAVVLGALSPRARNAQVALYRSGEVDYLVATDAIGMGLNMDVEQVAFADLVKFDGVERRPLAPAELAQIAGRAGRHLNDGTFTTLAPLPPLAPEVARAIEHHEFPAQRRLVWRNNDLDMTSVDALIASLRRPPRTKALRLVRRTDDFDALTRLAMDGEVRARATTPDDVALLWDVCRIPDFRQLMLDDHVDLLRAVFRQLTSPGGHIDVDWMARRITHLDNLAGDIDALLNRMAFVRTWTYITHRASWLDDAESWQERTRAIEDGLSDALHEQLIERFVERRGRTRRGHRSGEAAATSTLTFERPDLTTTPFDVLAELGLAPHGAERLRETWIDAIIAAPHASFRVELDGHVWLGEQRLARLKRGVDLLHPEVMLIDDTIEGAAARSRVERRLVAWSRDLIAEVLGPLDRLDKSASSATVRGLAHHLERSLGTTTEKAARAQARALSARDRAQLEECGVHLGRRVIYLRHGLAPAIVARRVALCAARWSRAVVEIAPPAAATSIAVDAEVDREIYEAIGFPVVGPRAFRADILERIFAAAQRAATGRIVASSPELRGIVARPKEELAAIIRALGFELAKKERKRPRRRAPVRAREAS